MKFPILSLLLFIFIMPMYSQIRAVTEIGEEVLLHSNGQWEYVEEQPDTVVILTNPTLFTSKENQSFDIKSKNTNTIVKLDAKQWTFGPGKNNQDAEYEFKLKRKDLYGMLITEGIEIPVENLAEIAIEYMKSASTNSVVLKKEYRQVNGQKVIYIEMSGKSMGIDLIYRGYYFSNLTGSTQLITWTSKNLQDKYTAETMDFLNGLTINK